MIGEKGEKAKVPALVWSLGLSMLLMNISSILVYICMPFFLTASMHMKESDAGAIEGAVEGFSLIIRTVTGSLSDFFERRKNFIIIGYAFSLLARMFLSISTSFDSIFLVISSRFLDKLGNGVQASPREAIISNNSPESVIGRAYGINKMLGVMGSAIGAVLALAIFLYSDNANFEMIFWIAFALVGFALCLVHFGVKEVTVPRIRPTRRNIKSVMRGAVADLSQFSFEYWKVIILGFLFKLGYFSGSYMMLLFKRQQFSCIMGLPLDKKPYLAGPVVMIMQNIISALFSLPLGNFSDKIDRRKSVALGLFGLLSSLICFGLFPDNIYCICLGVAFYGFQFAMQGALLALLAMKMPKKLHGTGFGMFYTITGISVIFTNVYIMGPIWDAYSPSAAFLTICIPIVGALLLLCTLKK